MTAPTAGRRPGGRPTVDAIGGNLLMVVGLAYFCIPLVWLLIASTKSNSGLFSSFGFWFDKDFALLKKLQDLFARDNGVFAVWMRNTAGIHPIKTPGMYGIRSMPATMTGTRTNDSSDATELRQLLLRQRHMNPLAPRRLPHRPRRT